MMRSSDVVLLGLLGVSGLAAGWAERSEIAVVLAALAAPIAGWWIRGIRPRELLASKSARIPMAIFVLGVLPSSIWASADLARSWPYLARLFWCVLVALTVSYWARTSSARTVPFLGVGVLAAVFGALSMHPVQKLAPFGALSMGLRELGETLGVPVLVEPNALAGALVLVVPLAVGWTVISFRDRWPKRFIFASCAAVLLSTLLLTQSRSGIAACALSLVLALLVLREWLWLAVLGGVSILGGIVLGPDRLWGYVAYGGRLQTSVLTGRPEIWERALQAVADVPLTGMGLGMFGAATRRIYPIRPIRPVRPLGFTDSPIDHAHNLYLDTAVALGILGLVVFLAVLAAAAYELLRLYRRSEPGTLARYWTVCLAAGLFAHALYGATDALPLGTMLDVVLWVHLGLIFGSTYRTARRRPVGAGVGQWIPFALILMILLLIAFPWGAVPRALSVNLASRTALEALLSDPTRLPAADDALERVAATACRANWLRGFVAEARGGPGRRTAIWTDVIACHPRFVELVRLAAPENGVLAEAAVELQPAEAESHFWLAELRGREAPATAAELYLRGLALKPHDGPRWLQLGDLVAETEPRMALDAYVKACRNGDPGANGCYRAGRTAEALGEPRSAIRYYRMSRWSAAAERAEELEERLPP